LVDGWQLAVGSWQLAVGSWQLAGIWRRKLKKALGFGLSALSFFLQIKKSFGLWAFGFKLFLAN